MKAVPYILGVNQGVVKEMAGSSHTPAPSCLSKHRSRRETGEKQPGVWLPYACSVTEEALYSSFDVPLPIPWYYSGVMGNKHYIHEVQPISTKCKRMLLGGCPLHPRRHLEGVTEMVHRSLGDDMEVYPSESSSNNEWSYDFTTLCFRSTNYSAAKVAGRAIPVT